MFYGQQCSAENIVLRATPGKYSISTAIAFMSESILEPWFVTGFCDGEAAFTFSRAVVNDATTNVTAFFSIRQRRDNEQIVRKLQKFFGEIGYIYIAKETLPTARSGHTKENAYYRVNKIDDLKKIIKHFDQYPLQSKKSEVYVVWKEFVHYKDRHYGSADRPKLEDFAKRIAFLNQKSRAFKKHTR